MESQLLLVVTPEKFRLSGAKCSLFQTWFFILSSSTAPLLYCKIGHSLNEIKISALALLNSFFSVIYSVYSWKMDFLNILISFQLSIYSVWLKQHWLVTNSSVKTFCVFPSWHFFKCSETKLAIVVFFVQLVVKQVL